MTWCISTLTTMSQWATKRNSRSFRRHAHLSQRTSRRAVRRLCTSRWSVKVVKEGRWSVWHLPVPSSHGSSFTLQGLNSPDSGCAVSPLGSVGSWCMAFMSSKVGVTWPEGHRTMEAWEFNFTSLVSGNSVKRWCGPGDSHCLRRVRGPSAHWSWHTRFSLIQNPTVQFETFNRGNLEKSKNIKGKAWKWLLLRKIDLSRNRILNPEILKFKILIWVRIFHWNRTNRRYPYLSTYLSIYLYTYIYVQSSLWRTGLYSLGGW